jgi:hypothetical protein
MRQRHDSLGRIPQAPGAARRLATLGWIGRARRRARQGRLVPAHGALSRAGLGQRDAGRIDRDLGAPEQRLAPARFRLGVVRRRRTPRGRRLPRLGLPRAAVLAGRRRATRRIRGRREPLREQLPPHAALLAARGIEGARRQAPLREHQAGRRRLARALDGLRVRDGAPLWPARRRAAGDRLARRRADPDLSARLRLHAPASGGHARRADASRCVAGR